LIVGLAIGICTAYCNGANASASARDLIMLKAFTLHSVLLTALYWLLYSVPAIVTTVVAVEVGGSRRMREWVRGNPTDVRKVAVLFFLVLTFALGGQLIVLIGR
jgi:hypothetical protein